MPAQCPCGPWLMMRQEQSTTDSMSVYPLRHNIFGDSDSPRRTV
ncbi:hypothetical protein [Gordonia asplenii]|nr:hypothetical protein [Gordonia asplenii]